MIPANAVASQLQAYIRAPEQSLVQVVDAIQEIQQLFTVGEQVRALVTSQLPTGRFAVLVKDQLLDLNLPRNTEAGEELDMRVVSNSPRLSFLLQRGNAEAAPLPQPVASNQSVDVELSPTARFIGNLITGTGNQDEATQDAQALARANPLFTEAKPDTVKLAETLKQVLSASGLFYESHVAEWAGGKRPLSQLQQEPPAKWLEAGASRPEVKVEAERLARPVLEGRTNTLALPEQEQELNRTGAELLAQEAAESGNSELDNMPAAARQLVQQQLQALDQRQVVWMGQAWPGQPLRWEVEEDGGNRSQEEGAQGKIWHTRLEMVLPHLGHVDILISLSDKTRVEVGFRVAEVATAERIRGAQSQLQAQLDAAGLELTANQVALETDDGS
ncbi:flagellar hook-length control protein FliK [Chitinimonas viridis]|uniref:Flagellar hook-length control protein FliK n=1 Tax=Chitinimonas viridis TaxID=664880 RepID=A0ABT8B6U1_9NEIS|nr:flagellar hook-length control protein FliK [Chitinimonas viridis]MDN3577482.1 flagellar hook-length control protein FliK [Chitinimonas viridis]